MSHVMFSLLLHMRQNYIAVLYAHKKKDKKKKNSKLLAFLIFSALLLTLRVTLCCGSLSKAFPPGGTVIFLDLKRTGSEGCLTSSSCFFLWTPALFSLCFSSAMSGEGILLGLVDLRRILLSGALPPDVKFLAPSSGVCNIVSLDVIKGFLSLVFVFGFSPAVRTGSGPSSSISVLFGRLERRDIP